MIPFESSRKRMGIIINDILTNKNWLYVKGADSIIKPMIKDKNS